MAPLVLKGDNLGNRRQHYNKLVNEAINEKISFEVIKSQEETSDIDKLFKIDVACELKNVDYIIDSLKSDDMLYVSRAIKQSPWLITDKQHSNIVNPQYLNDVLFPQMISKAACKFLLHVRLNLKDESRVEDFFKYYEDKDVKVALKWLPNCSLFFIEKAVEKYCNELEKDLFKRLCEKSFSVLEIFNKKNCRGYSKMEYIKAVIFLINTNTERYLDIFEESNMDRFHSSRLGPKQTETVMKKCPNRILDNFEKYATSVDITTVAKYLGKNNIKEFLLKQQKNPKMPARWFCYENIKKFVEFMPKAGKFEFLKQVFIEKQEVLEVDSMSDATKMTVMCSAPMAKCRSLQQSSNSKPSSIYQWYRHAPFEIAFTELKKLIRTDSSPDERINMLIVMLNTAGANANHIKMVLQYFHDRHINEPFKFKNTFIHTLLSTTETHRYDENCWNILDKIFHSMEVYIESDNDVHRCTESVIIRKIIHNEKLPDIIEKDFSFNTFKNLMKKFNKDEKSKVFAYLYNFIEQKIKKTAITTTYDIDKVATHLNDAFQLIEDWDKELSDYPYVLNKMKEVIKLTKEKSWACSFIHYPFVKSNSWKKLMFEESLLVSPSEETCYNAIKHDPKLLERYSAELDGLRYADRVSLKQTLRKIRTYWPDSLAKEWSDAYRARLEVPGGHKAVIRGLCTLLPRENLSEILKKYAPEVTKIDWSEADQLKLSLQKQIAMNMHIARPQPLPESVLLYAKGDYLQFTLPSLNAIYYNLSAARSKEQIPKLLDAPVSIQKHGIRLAFNKLKLEEVKEILLNIWNTTKNASIRKVIFELAFALLCKEKSPEKAEDLWQMLEAFIDNLTEEENKDIYVILSKVRDVPENIQGRFCMKNYNFLKSLPAKLDCRGLTDTLALYSAEIIEKMDPDFVRDILLEYVKILFVENKVLNDYASLKRVVTAYLLCSQSEKDQQKRYDQIFVPIMKNCTDRWYEVYEKSFRIRDFFINILSGLCEELERFYLQRNIVVPVILFTNILNEMEKRLVAVENYKLITGWKINTAFVQCVNNIRPTITQGECRVDEKEERDLCNKRTVTDRFAELLSTKVTPDFGKSCVELLKKDLANYYPTIFSAFTKVLIDATGTLSMSQKNQWVIYEAFLEDAEFHPGYLVVTKMISEYYITDEFKQNKIDVFKRIMTHPSVEVKMNFYNKFGHDAEFLK